MIPNIQRMYFATGVIAVLLIVLPAVHELGHYLPGVLLGAEVRDVTWTVLGGHAPKVSFVLVSSAAMPWVDAGGTLLSMAIGLVLVCVWALRCPRLRSPFWLFLLICGIALSFNAVGAAIEAFGPTTSYAHLRGLAHHVGLTGSAAVGFQLLPAIFAISVFYGAYIRYRLIRTSTNTAQ